MEKTEKQLILFSNERFEPLLQKRDQLTYKSKRLN